MAEAPVPITKILIHTRQRIEGAGHALGPFKVGPAGKSAVCAHCGGGVIVLPDGSVHTTPRLNRPCVAVAQETGR